MQRLITIGVVLIALGILGFVFPRIAFTEEETVIDAGPVEVEAERERSVTIPDIAAGSAVAVGTILVIVGAGRKS